MLNALVMATAAKGSNSVASVTPIPDSKQSVFNADAKHTEQQIKGFKDLQGPAYRSLFAFMREQEREGGARCCKFFRCFCGETPKPAGVEWREQMVQIENGIRGWAWVLKGNEENYRRQNLRR